MCLKWKCRLTFIHENVSKANRSQSNFEQNVRTKTDGGTQTDRVPLEFLMGRGGTCNAIAKTGQDEIQRH